MKLSTLTGTMYLVFVTFAVPTADADPLTRTLSPGTYQKPEQTARMMKLPKGFRVQVFAGEPDVVQPMAFCIDARGRLWVVENLSYPHWVAEAENRVVIFTDTNGDGRFDQRKVFWEKGNFPSGIQVGFGGVWVGSAPHLLFIPDRDGDDVPDGEAVKLLDGWGGRRDTHEMLNSFVWGPDGWLYGCNGIFSQSKVGKPGATDQQRIAFNAGIWRYHPTRHVFELFAQGGSNQWGLDFNDYGQAFMTCCVIPHLFHIAQGGRYRRQSGRQPNPFTYFHIKTIRTQSHFGSAFAGAMIYLGDSFPDRYRNKIFMNNLHANKIHVDLLERKGSGYVGKLGPHDEPVASERDLLPHEKRGAGFLDSGDKWYRGLCLRTGPDGSVFVNDWYDKRACHELRPSDQDLEFKTGRVYKISYGDSKPIAQIDLVKATDEALVEYQLHKNDWYVRTARRILQDRAARGELKEETRGKLLSILQSKQDATRRLRAAWALHVTGGIDEAITLELLEDEDEYLRAWAIQCELEDRIISDALLTRFEQLARDDPSQLVRLYLASACQRMPVAKRWNIVEGLISHEEDAQDQNLPQMYWYAAEPLCALDKNRAVQLTAKAKIPALRHYFARRISELK